MCEWGCQGRFLGRHHTSINQEGQMGVIQMKRSK